MKQRQTQRLFWKKWPYKIVLDLAVPEKPQPIHAVRWTRLAINRRESRPEWINFRRWQKKNLPDCGLRSEGDCASLFLDTQEQVDLVTDTWTSYVKEIWSPKNTAALEAMRSHVYDVIRENPWYRRFPIRARVLYTQDFRASGLAQFKQALESLEQTNWHAAGALKTLLGQDDGRAPYAFGQPYYLYLTNNDDAVMLKLQVGDWIERFERQRKP